MSIAARVAGWQKRLGGKPGPFGVPQGSGEQPSGALVQIELFVDGLWTDITPYVMVRDGSQRVTIVRGQANEGNRTDASRCSMQINNRDGRFSPRNPTSPYYGKLGRNQPIRVSVPDGNAKNYRFWGEVASWPQGWDTTGTDVWVDLQAAGILRRLGQGSSPLRSAMYREMTNPARTGIVAYWPCEDMAGAVSIASGLSGPPMLITGVPELAAYSDWVASAPIPTMGTAGFVGTVPAYAATGEASYRVFVHPPDGGVATNQNLIGFNTTGSAFRWQVVLDTVGNLALLSNDAGGTTILNSGFIGFGINGKQTLVIVELTQVGADISWALVVQTFPDGVTVLSSSFSGTLAANTFGIVTNANVGGDAGLADVAIGHITVADDVQAFAGTGNAVIGWNSETATSRITRLCRESGIASTVGGSSVAMGPQRPAKLLDLIQECVDADLGTLYEPRTFLGIGYRSRALNYNQPANIALSYAGFNLSEVPVPVDDDSFTRNDITVSRVNGSSARSVLESGPLSVADPPAGVGRYDDTKTVNVQLDSQLADQAGWRLLVGTVDEARYPRIAVNLAHSTFQNDAALRSQLLAIDMGWRLTMVDLPPWLPPDDVSQLAIGQEEVIDQFQHRVAFNCAPESPYRVATADSATLGRADTAGSSLAADVTSTDTAFSLATTSGPTWATDTAEYPFDLRVGGEVVTAAAPGTLLNANPFFTTDLTGWTDVGQNSTISRSTVIVNTDRDAVASMLIVPNGVGASGGGASTPLTAVGTITAGASYQASLWAYSPGGWSDLRPAVDWYDAAGAFISSGLGSGTSVSAGVWTYITQTLVAPALASRAVMRARHGGTPAVSDVWYVWAVRLIATASVSSVSPQIVTVVRSVNGVVKAHTAGADIRLNQPAIVAL